MQRVHLKLCFKSHKMTAKVATHNSLVFWLSPVRSYTALDSVPASPALAASSSNRHGIVGGWVLMSWFIFMFPSVSHMTT